MYSPVTKNPRYLSQCGGWAAGWMIGVRFPVEVGSFSSNHCIHTDSGAHTASYPMGTGDLSPEVAAGA
jgi:hypothetical protein